MNWYNQFKISSLEPNWWQNFYDHFSKAIPFIMNIPNATTRFNTSGNDGNKIWYSFGVNVGPNKYSCSINLEFSARIDGKETVWKNQQGEVTWQNSSLQQVKPHPNVELVKYHWYVIKNMHLGGSLSEVVGQGFTLAQKATPVSILTQIKNAILQDLNDDRDDDGGTDQPQVGSPTPSRGLLAPVG